MDIESKVALEEHVAAHVVVISLIPYIYHAMVIKAAIKRSHAGRDNKIYFRRHAPTLR